MAKMKLRQLQCNGKKWTIKQLNKMVQNGTIQIAKRIQRAYGAWDNKQKSRFILSLILHRPIPNLYAKRVEITDENGNKKYTFFLLDGQHRLMTTVKFIADEFKLVDFPDIEIFDECENEWVLCENLSGKTFSELPEVLQDEIMGNGLTVTYIENLTDEEEDEIFINLNNGKSLNNQTKTFAYASDKENLVRLAKHEVFKEMYSERAILDHKAESWIIKAEMMMTEKLSEINFKANTVNDFAKSHSISNVEKIEAILDYTMEVFNILADDKKKRLAKKMVKDTHFISLVPYFAKAIDRDFDTFDFADFIEKFYNVEGETSISEKYNLASSNAGGSNTNIVKRHEALGKYFREFFEGKETCTEKIEAENNITTTTSENEVVEVEEVVVAGDDTLYNFIENIPSNSEIRIVDNYGEIIGYDANIVGDVLYMIVNGDEMAINVEDVIRYEVA